MKVFETTLDGGAAAIVVEMFSTRVEIAGKNVAIVAAAYNEEDSALFFRRFKSAPGVEGDMVVSNHGATKEYHFLLKRSVSLTDVCLTFSDLFDKAAWEQEKKMIEHKVPSGLDLPVRWGPLPLKENEIPFGEKETILQADVIYVDGRPAAVCRVTAPDRSCGRVEEFWTCLKGFRVYSNNFNNGLKLTSYAMAGGDEKEYSCGLAQHASSPYVRVLAEHGGNKRIIDVLGGGYALKGRKLKDGETAPAKIETRKVDVNIYSTFVVLKDGEQWLLVARGGYHVVDNTEKEFNLHLFATHENWANGSEVWRSFMLTIPKMGEARRLNEREGEFNRTKMIYLVTDLKNVVIHHNMELGKKWMLRSKKAHLLLGRWTYKQRYTGYHGDDPVRVRSVDLI